MCIVSTSPSAESGGDSRVDQKENSEAESHIVVKYVGKLEHAKSRIETY
jgi:hypothetical protein